MKSMLTCAALLALVFSAMFAANSVFVSSQLHAADTEEVYETPSDRTVYVVTNWLNTERARTLADLHEADACPKDCSPAEWRELRRSLLAISIIGGEQKMVRGLLQMARRRERETGRSELLSIIRFRFGTHELIKFEPTTPRTYEEAILAIQNLTK